mmetsp:Transcript_32837/g.77857  ORF Transcript_32837/g.77857 Transcript_32837/m.77857 type:complete len:367 (-) Transcript_32837:777-1877(-)
MEPLVALEEVQDLLQRGLEVQSARLVHQDVDAPVEQPDACDQRRAHQHQHASGDGDPDDHGPQARRSKGVARDLWVGRPVRPKEFRAKLGALAVAGQARPHHADVDERVVAALLPRMQVEHPSLEARWGVPVAILVEGHLAAQPPEGGEAGQGLQHLRPPRIRRPDRRLPQGLCVAEGVRPDGVVDVERLHVAGSPVDLVHHAIVHPRVEVPVPVVEKRADLVLLEVGEVHRVEPLEGLVHGLDAHAQQPAEEAGGEIPPAAVYLPEDVLEGHGRHDPDVRADVQAQFPGEIEEVDHKSQPYLEHDDLVRTLLDELESAGRRRHLQRRLPRVVHCGDGLHQDALWPGLLLEGLNERFAEFSTLVED